MDTFGAKNLKNMPRYVVVHWGCKRIEFRYTNFNYQSLYLVLFYDFIFIKINIVLQEDIACTLKILCTTRWYFLKWNLVCMVTKHRKVSIQKLVGIYILTTILKKKVSSRELLFGPTSMSTCRRCIVVYLVARHAAKAIKAGMASVGLSAKAAPPY